MERSTVWDNNKKVKLNGINIRSFTVTGKNYTGFMLFYNDSV